MADHIETIEQLTNRARALIKKADDHATSAGVVLAELKTRITDRDADEGKAYGWSWKKFTDQNELHVGKDGRPIKHRRLNDLIRYATDPEAADQARAKDRERKRGAKREQEFLPQPIQPPAADRVAELEAQLAERDARIAELEAEVDRLQAELAEARAVEPAEESAPEPVLLEKGTASEPAEENAQLQQEPDPEKHDLPEQVEGEVVSSTLSGWKFYGGSKAGKPVCLAEAGFRHPKNQNQLGDIYQLEKATGYVWRECAL